jgi:hypothetical protein
MATPLVPHVIGDDMGPGVYNVNVVNSTTGESCLLRTSTAGDWDVDLSDYSKFPTGYVAGDVIIIDINGAGSGHKEYTVVGLGNVDLNITITATTGRAYTL